MRDGVFRAFVQPPYSGRPMVRSDLRRKQDDNKEPKNEVEVDVKRYDGDRRK